MTAQVVNLRDFTIERMVNEVHKNFASEREAGNRADRARIRAGQLLLALRERIEAGEVGPGVEWWDWYGANITRTRRDANKVMKLARAADPEAAAETERTEARDRMAKHRAGANVRPKEDDEVADPVEQALELVEDMTTKQRQRFFAALRSAYAYAH
jgi:hypothetical protein